uniref:SCP domain-containing protein n=1 Tax=Strongyloides papillosus TaxID=174720 RepID=A0A0N5BMB1_STREA
MERGKNLHPASRKSAIKKRRKLSWKKRLSRNSKRKSSLGDIYENEEFNSSLSRSNSKSSRKSKNGKGLATKVSDEKNLSNKKSLMQRVRSRFSRKHRQSINTYENTSGHEERKSFLQRLSLRRTNKKKDDTIYENISNHGERKSFLPRLTKKRSSKKKDDNVYETPYDQIRRPSSTSSRRQSNDNEGYLVDPAKSNSFRKQTTSKKPVIHPPNRRGSSLYGRLDLKKPIFYEKYNGFNITPFLSQNKFSSYIYKKVWSDCDYTCFYKNGYQRYKIKTYLHINLLRKYHYAQPLVQNSLLNRLAQEHADKMARRRSIIRFDSILYGATLGATFYPAASTIVTRWYDEYKNHSFFLNYKRPGSQQLTQLLWKDSKEVGIGAARGDNILYLVCLYYPKGNIDGLFRKNVLKRQRNWEQ